MPPPSSLGAPKRQWPVVLGIDWGSTSIRLVLYHVHHTPGVERLEPLWNDRSSQRHDPRSEQGSFSSYITVFDESEAYVGDHVDLGRQRISTKFLFGDANGLTPEHSLWEQIAELKGRPQFEKRRQHGMQQVVKTFARAARQRCEDGDVPLEIKGIGLSVPAAWTLDEEAEYSRLLKEAFSKKGRMMRQAANRICFHTEVKAMAHFLMGTPRYKREVVFGDKDAMTLLLDFGGHSMNGCAFMTRRRGKHGTDVAFFRASEPFEQGIGGGTEHWEAYVNDLFTNYVRENYGASFELSQEVRSALLYRFHEAVMQMDCGKFRPMVLRAEGIEDDIYDHIEVKIPAPESEQMFLKALGGPLELARQSISQLGREYPGSKDSGLRVLVSGGSARSEIIKACIRRCCADAGLESPQFIHEEMGKLGTFNIARGAAIARAKDMSFRNFLENGAAIGVQMLQAGERDWDNVAKTILDENGGKNIEIIAAAGDRLRLICDPFCRLNRAGSNVEQSNSYDILELPAPSEGRWMYTLEWKGYSESTLALLKRVEIQRTYDYAEPGEWDGLSPLKIPLYFDRSANCFLVNTDGHDIEFLRRGILIRDDGTMTACPEENTGGDAENEDPEEGARAIRRLVDEVCSLGPRSDIQPKTRKSGTLKRGARREEGEGSDYCASMKKRASDVLPRVHQKSSRKTEIDVPQRPQMEPFIWPDAIDTDEDDI